MEMVALVLLGVLTMAIIERQKRRMERLVKIREEKPIASKAGRRG